ncbi:MAG: ribosome biogenesis GTP-binding protein YihA/YsxC [Bacillota bacterium]|nr:ribosome biogenesis GTP-binding protein YihA/YsxC [Bacillota bacterium]
MIVNNAKYELTAVRPEQYPAGSMPEVAFAGRSNVGKSSIINTLTNRKNIARVGATPGKTKEINFYNIEEKLYFVDLPGYGYAKVSKEKKASWNEVIETYLYTRKQLQFIILLVDIRHAPSEDDKAMYEWMKSHNIPYVIVAAKADKITKSQINVRLKEIKAVLGVPEGIEPIPFSSETRQGKDQVWGRIDQALNLV